MSQFFYLLLLGWQLYTKCKKQTKYNLRFQKKSLAKMRGVAKREKTQPQYDLS